MEALTQKTLEQIAKKLAEEISEVGANFGDIVTNKLKKYGYDPQDAEVRKQVVSKFFDLRR